MEPLTRETRYTLALTGEEVRTLRLALLLAECDTYVCMDAAALRRDSVEVERLSAALQRFTKLYNAMAAVLSEQPEE